MTAAVPAHRLVVGLEVHLQLRTRTKCFCPCAVEFGGEPNVPVCPVCLGLPGALPVLNAAAVEQAVRGALGLGCRIADETRWDRKNYFYPDLPKGYQITQHARPIGTEGRLELEGPDGPYLVRVERVHLEEDTARLVHAEDGSALVDFGRAGIPLLEVVTLPDLRSAADASRFLEELRRIVRWLGISDADMEKGQLRCEPNVNVEVELGGEWVASPIVEVKNLNSFAAVRHAIEHERERQVAELVAGGPRGPRPKRTRGWDDAARATFPMRAKEEAADYRYFPDPDLPPLSGMAALAEGIAASLPALPRERRRRLVEDLGLGAADAAVIAEDRELADWFEAAAEAAGDARLCANWTVTDVRRELNARGVGIGKLGIAPEDFGSFLRALGSNRLPRESGKTVVFPAMAESGRPWRDIVRELGLGAVSADDLETIVREVLADRPEVVRSIRAGRGAARDVLVGEVMKRTRGAGDPRLAASILDRLLA